MWTYGGTFPGPTIRRPAGEPTEVTFVHGLPAKAGELTVHLHGGHNRSAEDGQPGGLTARQPRVALLPDLEAARRRDSGNELLIEPGGRRTYHYDLVEDGAPERAAFQWYHDHRLERTGRNVWRGLAGMMDPRRRARRLAAASDRRPRHPADARRPLLRQAQPAHGPVQPRRPRAQRRRHRQAARWSTASTSPTTTSSAARYRLRILNAAQLQPLQPRAVGRRRR